ncbi:hypothetical protein HK097_009366 [Rhizophlyctis rosea]|uniref:Uncharacterized protein n=1 Tax=Rhizophlyctis rosea TaxID=64517 RepID=A0AAD5SC39_9FUNG|nr:hypothetical protein HK097_009366 [Rhizophlyctis rosea]
MEKKQRDAMMKEVDGHAVVVIKDRPGAGGKWVLYTFAIDHDNTTTTDDIKFGTGVQSRNDLYKATVRFAEGSTEERAEDLRNQGKLGGSIWYLRTRTEKDQTFITKANHDVNAQVKMPMEMAKQRSSALGIAPPDAKQKHQHEDKNDDYWTATHLSGHWDGGDDLYLAHWVTGWEEPAEKEGQFGESGNERCSTVLGQTEMWCRKVKNGTTGTAKKCYVKGHENDMGSDSADEEPVDQDVFLENEDDRGSAPDIERPENGGVDSDDEGGFVPDDEGAEDDEVDSEEQDVDDEGDDGQEYVGVIGVGPMEQATTVDAGDHIFETQKDTTSNEYSASFLSNPSAQPTDPGVPAGAHIIETAHDTISLNPPAAPSEPIQLSTPGDVPDAGDHIIVAQKDPLDITPTAQPTAAPADLHPPTEAERLDKAGRVTEHYDNKAQQYVANAQGTAQQYAASAQTAAQPYIEQARSVAAGVATQAQPLVEQARSVAAGVATQAQPYVESVKSAAAPYVESARSTAAPYIESARSTAAGVQQSVQSTTATATESARSTAAGVQQTVASNATVAQQKAATVAAQARETAGPYIEQVKTTAAQVTHQVTEAVNKVTSIPAVHNTLDQARSLTNQTYETVSHNPTVAKAIETVEPYVKKAANVVEPYVKAAQEALSGHPTVNVTGGEGAAHVASAVETKGATDKPIVTQV